MRYLGALGRGFLTGIVFVILAGFSLLASLIAENYFDAMRISYLFYNGAVAVGVVGLIVVVLVIYSGCIAETTNNQRAGNMVIIHNGKVIPVSPQQDIPHYVEDDNPQKALLNGIGQLDEQTLQALYALMENQQKYLPKYAGGDAPGEEIRNF